MLGSRWQDYVLSETLDDHSDKLGDGYLFYEYNYGEYFERYQGEVLSAEYRFNRLLSERGYATLNDFYRLLYLPTTEEGDILGWIFGNDYYGMPYVNFEHEKVELEDGMECYIITMPEPSSEYLYY